MNENVEIMQAAEKYRKLRMRIKELEKQAAPYKKILREHAAGIGERNVDLGSIAVHKRVTRKLRLNEDAVTWKWIRQMNSTCLGNIVHFVVDPKYSYYFPPKIQRILDEMDHETTETESYVVRVS